MIQEEALRCSVFRMVELLQLGVEFQNQIKIIPFMQLSLYLAE